MSLECCIDGCKNQVKWRMVWYNAPKVGETLEIIRERNVCDTDWHILRQRSIGYPSKIFNIETGESYNSLIEDRAIPYEVD